MTDDAGTATLLADNDLLRRQLDANSVAHRAALADLRASEERLEMALSAGDGIGTWDWNVVHDRVVADTRFARLHGLEAARAASGMPFADYLAVMLPEDRSTVEAAIASVMQAGGPFTAEYRLRRPDGSLRWVAAQGHCVLDRDGRPLRFPGVTFDITARKSSEEQLRVLNANLAEWVDERTRERDQLWELSEDLLIAADVQGKMLKVSPSWTRLLGRSETDLMDGGYAALIHPDDLLAVTDAIEAMRRTNTPVRFENRLSASDGTWKWLSWTLSPDPDGRRLTGIGRDVTGQKERQAALAAAEDALRQSQKMEAVGQLTGGVAHDFNNLLTVIRSSVDLLKRPNLSEQRRQRYIEAIADTTTRASKLTGQLLAFARRQALMPEVFDVVQGVSRMRDMVGTLTGSRIHIAFEVPDTPCFIDADPSQFDTAMVNLAANARDAMDGEGSLTISVKGATAIPAMRAHGEIIGDYVAVSMSDTGSGIAAGDLERIFEPFFTTKAVGQGTGLGLSQVFGFVKQSGGEVAVRSEVGRGTTFTLFLPRATRAAAEAVAVQNEEVIEGHGTFVLVVEDNADVGTFATQTLAELGYDTLWAASAEAALTALDEDASRFDVVFSDVVMPGMNGIELGQEIRRRYDDLPVVLTSGYSDVLAQNGTHGFELLHKPYSIEQLSRVLSKAAIWRRLRRPLAG